MDGLQAFSLDTLLNKDTSNRNKLPFPFHDNSDKPQSGAGGEDVSNMQKRKRMCVSVCGAYRLFFLPGVWYDVL